MLYNTLIYTVFLLLMALFLDAFAATAAFRRALRARQTGHYAGLMTWFALFQVFMLVPGWILGLSLRGYMNAQGWWIVMGLLVWAGGNMLRSGLTEGKGKRAVRPARDTEARRGLLFSGVATGIDALGAGLCFALLQTLLLGAGKAANAAVCALIAAYGLYLVKILIRPRWGELLGGAILLAAAGNLILSLSTLQP